MNKKILKLTIKDQNNFSHLELINQWLIYHFKRQNLFLNLKIRKKLAKILIVNKEWKIKDSKLNRYLLIVIIIIQSDFNKLINRHSNRPRTLN